MKKFVALLRVSLMAMLLGVTGGRKSKRKKISGLGACALLAFIALYVSGVYSGLLIQVLAPIRMEELVILFMGIGSVFGGMLFSVFGASKTLFGGKDNDLLLSLPVSTKTLLAAKMTAVYLEELLFTFFMLLPAGVVCRIYSDAALYRTIGYWLRLLLSALLLPMLTTALAVAVGALIAWISSHMKRRALGENILMGLYLAVVFWFAFGINGRIEGLATTAFTVKDGMTWALPVVWMGDGIMGDIAAWLKFAAVCVAAATAVVLALGSCFKRAVTAFGSVSARSNYRMTAQQSLGARRALLRKEAQKFFGLPIYFWNSGLGLMMALALAVASLVKGADVLRIAEEIDMEKYLPMVACAIMAFCLSTAMITAPSFSIEGKYLWILREAPVETRTIIRTKILFQQLLAQPVAIFTALCLAFSLKMSVRDGMGVLLFGILFELFHGLFGAWIGLRHVRLDMEERYVIKQSMASFMGIFMPMLAVAILGVGFYFLNDIVETFCAFYIALLALALLTAAFGFLLRRNGVKMFEHMGE